MDKIKMIDFTKKVPSRKADVVEKLTSPKIKAAVALVIACLLFALCVLTPYFVSLFAWPKWSGDLVAAATISFCLLLAWLFWAFLSFAIQTINRIYRENTLRGHR